MTDDSIVRQLIQDITLAEAIDRALGKPVVQFLVDQVETERAACEHTLKTADPFKDPSVILRMQERLKAFEEIWIWMAEAVQRGEMAAAQLEEVPPDEQTPLDQSVSKD